MSINDIHKATLELPPRRTTGPYSSELFGESWQEAAGLEASLEAGG